VYEKIDTVQFHAGWLIVNKAYTIVSNNYIESLQHLSHQNFFDSVKKVGDIEAYHLSSKQQLQTVSKLQDDSLLH